MNFILFFIIYLIPSYAEKINIDLSDASKWKCFSYDDYKQSKMEFSKQGIIINVDQSSSPCLYKFDKVYKVKKIKVTAKSTAKFSIPKGKTQGDKSYDDFALRAGLILVGDSRPNAMTRWFLPQWIKKILELAPKGLGFEKLYLLTSAQSKKILGRKRQHYASKYITEKAVGVVQENGDVLIEEETKEPWKAYALWIAADGDDLKSKFVTNIKSIEIER